MSVIFSDIEMACCEGCDDPSSCCCSQTEMALRRYDRGDALRAMNEVEREWCINEIIYCGEGEYIREEIEDLDDKALAHVVLRAWTNYILSTYNA